jgi:hypothetical protein
MSRHIPRHERWQRLGPNEHSSLCGTVRYERGAWWALLAYRQCEAPSTSDALLEWQEHEVRLGPFKRPRNAMIAVEDHVLQLQRRLGDRVVIHPRALKP